MNPIKLYFLVLIAIFSVHAQASLDPELVKQSQILQQVVKYPSQELRLNLISSKGLPLISPKEKVSLDYKLESVHFINKEFNGYCQKAIVLLVSNKPNLEGHKDYRLFGQEAFFIPSGHFMEQNQFMAEFLSRHGDKDYFVFAQFGNVYTKDRECKLNVGLDNIIQFTGRFKAEDDYFQEIYSYSLN